MYVFVIQEVDGVLTTSHPKIETYAVYNTRALWGSNPWRHNHGFSWLW